MRAQTLIGMSCLESARRLQHQIVGIARESPSKRSGDFQLELGARRDLDAIACLREHDQAFQRMIAVAWPIADMQEKIDLGRSANAQLARCIGVRMSPDVVAVRTRDLSPEAETASSPNCSLRSIIAICL